MKVNHGKARAGDPRLAHMQHAPGLEFRERQRRGLVRWRLTAKSAVVRARRIAVECGDGETGARRRQPSSSGPRAWLNRRPFAMLCHSLHILRRDAPEWIRERLPAWPPACSRV